MVKLDKSIKCSLEMWEPKFTKGNCDWLLLESLVEYKGNVK